MSIFEVFQSTADNTVLTRGKRVTRIAVVNPVESMWIKSGSDDITKASRKNLEKNFKELAQCLLYNTLDFDYLSELLLCEQSIKYCDKQINILMKASHIIQGKTIPKYTLV